MFHSINHQTKVCPLPASNTATNTMSTNTKHNHVFKLNLEPEVFHAQLTGNLREPVLLCFPIISQCLCL